MIHSRQHWWVPRAQALPRATRVGLKEGDLAHTVASSAGCNRVGAEVKLARAHYCLELGGARLLLERAWPCLGKWLLVGRGCCLAVIPLLWET